MQTRSEPSNLDDAQVDKGVTTLSLPKRLIDELGLVPLGKRQTRTATFRYYAPVRLTVQGRDCNIEVAEGADESPVLIGFIPLDMLDFSVDLESNRLIGNPDNGRVQIYDRY